MEFKDSFNSSKKCHDYVTEEFQRSYRALQFVKELQKSSNQEMLKIEYELITGLAKQLGIIVSVTNKCTEDFGNDFLDPDTGAAFISFLGEFSNAFAYAANRLGEEL